MPAEAEKKICWMRYLLLSVQESAREHVMSSVTDAVAQARWNLFMSFCVWVYCDMYSTIKVETPSRGSQIFPSFLYMEVMISPQSSYRFKSRTSKTVFVICLWISMCTKMFPYYLWWCCGSHGFCSAAQIQAGLKKEKASTFCRCGINSCK